MNLQANLRSITPQEFAHLGVNDIAYVKRVIVDDAPAYAVHAADGTPMAVLRDHATAVAALLQHDLEAVSVH
ncbi:MAG TPA: DUF1150 family protein [Stellaceae bacterium]|nr:DUF1150 family protein [Stellaceae bacterium]